ncbi:MAG: Ig-like domain-containing protein, partial [Verrucomicrobia bacterium]|nr:Ig-like domain-containing protein [Verrucomicrobiota bacterium]
MKAIPPIAIGLVISLWLLSPSTQGGGLTVLTHGYSSGTGDWVQAMAEAISARLGGSENVIIYNLKVSAYKSTLTGDVSPAFIKEISKISGPTLWGAEHGGEVIVKLDWSEIDALGTVVSAREVGEVAANFFLTNQVGGHFLIEQPIHLIGHSRGGSVNSSLAKVLAERNVWVDHMTTLDPHPVGLFSDPKVECWDNVRFADNWYRTTGFPEGQIVGGAQNADLSKLVSGSTSIAAHTRVHAFYHGTIDLATSRVAGEDIQANWYARTNPLELPWTGPRDLVGFFWSRIGASSSVNNPGGNVIRFYRPLGGLPEGLGGRQGVTRIGTQWPNVEIVNFLDDLSVTMSKEISITLRYTTNAPDAEISVGFDDDGNPYNGFFGNPAFTKTVALLREPTADATLGISSLSTNKSYFVYARISNADFSRYSYAPGRVVKGQPDEPPKLPVGPATLSSLLVATSPASGAPMVARNTDIFIRFSKPMNSATLTTTTIQVVGSSSGSHPGVMSYDGATYTLTVNPNVDFSPGEIVTVTVSRAVRAQDDDVLASEYVVSFMSIGTAPTPQPVGGPLATDATWRTGNIYLVTNDVVVPAGRTLTIEGGAVVKFQAVDTAPANGGTRRRYNLIVHGTLNLQGTASQRVVFTSSRDDTYGGDSNGDGVASQPGAGNWGAIIYTNPSNVLHDAVVRYGGLGQTRSYNA